MLYYLQDLMRYYSPLRIFQYITFRAFMSAGTAFAISMLFGPALIRLLRRIKFGQEIRKEHVGELYEMHRKKQGTPTMGGVLIILSVVVSTLLWADPANRYVLLTLGSLCVMGTVGFRDDWLKIRKRNSKGLSARGKLIVQTAWAVVITLYLWNTVETHERVRQLMVPFLKDPVVVGMHFAAVLGFVWLVMVGSTNAVNLTDGLDGLAIGCANSVALAYLVMTYVAGHAVFAQYLQVPYVAESGELAVFCGALLGAGLGFLWFNCHPAEVFMGDTGSLAIGGAIAMIAILINQELILFIVGFVFVLEAASVLIQVSWFKYTRHTYGEGRRVLLCSPLHHHFERKLKARALSENRDVEVVETTVTIRFWILSIICALLGVATLKIR